MMKIVSKFSLLAFAASMLIACNQSTPGQNTTDAGTQQSDNSVNSDMESQRTPSDVDTITSPGSNSLDLKGEKSNTGTTEPNTGTADPNMKGQSDTHGKDTKAGQ